MEENIEFGAIERGREENLLKGKKKALKIQKINFVLRKNLRLMYKFENRK